MVRDKQLCTSWGKKMEAKREKLLLKQYSLQLKEEKARQKEVSWSCNPVTCAVKTLSSLVYLCVPLFSRQTGRGEKNT